MSQGSENANAHHIVAGTSTQSKRDTLTWNSPGEACLCLRGFNSKAFVGFRNARGQELHELASHLDQRRVHLVDNTAKFEALSNLNF